MTKTPNRPRQALAAAAALMVAVGGILLPSSAAIAAPTPTSSAGLDWGIKESFRTYIGTIAHGTINLSDGATRNDDGTFHFPLDEGSYDPETKTLDLQLDGGVSFSGHDGALEMAVSAPRVLMEGTSGTLFATLSSLGLDGSMVDYGEVAFAVLSGTGERSVGEDTLSWTGLSASLTSAGAPVFAGYYNPGQLLDKLTLSATGTWDEELPEPEAWTDPSVDVYIPDGSMTVGAGASQIVIDEAREILFAKTDSYWNGSEQVPASIIIRSLSTGEVTQTIDEVGIAGIFDVVPSSGALIARIGLGYTLIRPGDDGRYHVAESLITLKDGVGVRFIGNTVGVDPETGTLYVMVTNAGASTLAGRGLYVYEELEGEYQFVEAINPTDLNLTVGGNAIEVDPTTGTVHIFTQAGGLLALIDGRPGAGGPRTILGEPKLIAPAITSGGSIASTADAATGTVYLTAPGGGAVFALQNGNVVDEIVVPGPYLESTAMTIDQGSGRVYVANASQGVVSIIEGRPAEGESRSVVAQLTLGVDNGAPQSIAVDGDGTPHVMLFSALPSSLVPDRPVRDQVVTISKFVTPAITAQPEDASVQLIAGGIGEDGEPLPAEPVEVTFHAATTGTPTPTVRWQMLTALGWGDLQDNESISGAATDTLTIAATEMLDGSQFRAVASNAVEDAFGISTRVGSIGSEAATLHVAVIVDQEPTAPAEGSGVTLAWTGSFELQSIPPFGTSNYLSAGTSDGTEASYSAETGNVRIVQQNDDTQTPASYATRAAHTASGGRQVAIVSDGVADLTNGAGTVTWDGSWTLNFYDGLVPFTVSDPVLTIDADGNGTLTADLSGYGSDPADPFTKHPVTPSSDVVVASFSDVEIDLENGFIVTPDYNGVTVELPSSVTAQNRTVSGWGSWPQSWVEFQTKTGLTSYWYSSGGAGDNRKAPAPFSVGFNEVTAPEPEDPGSTPEVPTIPEPPITVVPSESGYLVWGVRGSFRDYVAGPIAKGSISLSGGASNSGAGYRFYQTGTNYNSSNGTGNASYAGAVTFRGHSGVLNVTLSNPSVVINSASSATLYMNANGSRIPIGNVNLSAAARSSVQGGVAYSGAPVTLTASGAGVFSYGSSQFYAPGTVMDPVSFVIGANSAAGSGGSGGTVTAYQSTEWTAPAEPPATTGLWIDPEALKELRPGTEVTVYGEGFDPNEADIKVVLYSDPIVLEENLTADANGTAKWTGLLPLDLEPGTHTLTFQGSQNLGIELTVLEAEAAKGCLVEDATLTWGFKQSFRSYISGSIAHGEWQVSDGATYETPSFGWNSGEGVFDAESFTGEVKFAGKISFSGHDGLLNTTVANPTLLFTGPEKAYLLLDVSGVTMDDALAGNTDNVLSFEQVSFLELDLSNGTVEVSEDGVAIIASEVPTKITSQGYEAFPNYEAGTEFDPISFEVVTQEKCGAEALSAISTGGDDAEPISTDDDAPIWPWLVGGGVLAALLVAGLSVWLVRRNRTVEDSGDGDATAEPSVEELLSGGGQ